MSSPHHSLMQKTEGPTTIDLATTLTPIALFRCA
jgi:hypothetical protein